MKVIIDLIEDLRESIQNNAEYSISAMLLTSDDQDDKKLNYAGEAPIAFFELDEERRELVLSIGKELSLKIGDFVKHLQIMGLDKMMYEVKIAVSPDHPRKEVVGFGVNAEESKYALFIMK